MKLERGEHGQKAHQTKDEEKSMEEKSYVCLNIQTISLDSGMCQSVT